MINTVVVYAFSIPILLFCTAPASRRARASSDAVRDLITFF